MVSIVSDEFLESERNDGEKQHAEHPFSTSFEENSYKIGDSKEDEASKNVPTLFHEQFNKLRKRATSEADELKISLTNLCGDDDKSALNNEWAADGELR